LKAAYWKAARDGLAGSAIDLAESHALMPTVDLLNGLIERVTPALRAVGDYALVRDELDRVVAEGNGAMRQQSAWRRRHEISDVVEEAARATLSGV
jgi:carboxylate-amine ligase